MSIVKPALERLLLEAHPRRQRHLNEACKQALETLQKDIDATVNRSSGIASNNAVAAPITDASVDADTAESLKNSTSSARSSKRSSVSSMPQATSNPQGTSSPDGLPVLPFDPYWKPFQIALDNALPVKTRVVALDSLSRIIAHKLAASDTHAALAYPFTSQRKSPRTTKVREGTTYFSDVNDLSSIYAHLYPSSVLLSPTTPKLPTTPATSSSPTTPGALSPSALSLVDDLIDCVCALYYGPSTDESVQVQIIKLLLTVMTSDVTEVHGVSLLKIVATLCNMHVYATTSVIIANTAKATLTQIVNIVVGRMEACASEVRSMVRGATGEVGDEEEGPTRKVREEAVAEEEKVTLKQVTPESEIEEKVAAEEIEQVKMETYEKVELKAESQAIEDAEEDAVVVEAEETDGYGDFEHVEKLRESELNSMESSEVVEAQVTKQSTKEVTEEVMTEEVSFKEIQAKDEPKPRPAINIPVGRHPPAELRLDTISSPVIQDPMVLRLELLREDVFVLIRLLCKLSTRIEANSSKQGATARLSPPTPLDELNLKGRALVLDLLLSLLNNASRHLQTHPSAHALLRSHVCVSLSQNSVSSDSAIFELSLSIFLVLLSAFRGPLKPEIEVLITEIYLPILDLPQATYSHRSLILEAVAKIGRNPRTLVDIYLNYDCDMNARSVFERIVASLSRVAQGRALNLGGSKLAGLIGAHSSGLLLDTKADVVALQERKMKVNGLKCMVEIANSLVEWADELKPNVGEKVAEQQGEEEDDGSPKHSMPTLAVTKAQQPIIVLRSPLAAITLNHDNHSTASLSSVGSASESVAEEPNAAKGYEEIVSRKQIMMKGVYLFNDKPDKGIAFLIEHGLVEDTPEGIATFLRSATSGLSKTAIGEYLGEGDAAHIRVMHQFVDQLDFQGLGFVAALRRFLQLYRLPGESQKIDRLMEKFADRYCETNPDGVFANADAAYTLAFSVIMLNTDQHSAQLRSRMTRADFVKNNRGINKNADLPEDYLIGIFDEISNNEIVLDEEMASKIGTRDEKRKVELQVAQMQKKSQQMIIAGQGRDRARMEGFKAAGRNREYVRPMFHALCWPLMATLSLAFEEVGTTSNTDGGRRGSGEGDADWSRANSEAIDLCLEGFQSAIRLAGMFRMEMERDAFVSGLAKLTGLNHMVEMKPKNVAAIRALLNAANRSGEYFDSSWLTVLKTISQMERLQLIGGNEIDMSVFGGGFDYSKQATPEEETARARKSIGGTPFGILLPMREPSPPPTPTATMTQNSTAAGRFAANNNNTTARPASLGPLMREFQSQSTLVTIDRLFSGSVSLSGGAIVHFFRALCEVSLEEIDLDSGTSATPRMYSLQRLIEIAYYNMGRIRFEWVPIWRILQPYFNAVGCHHDARVATFAIDSLRQLSMKLLEREELGHFHTQNEFLKPFEYIMRHAKGDAAGTIRDFIVQSLVQMITARATSIKSGWRSVFVIFARAAVDQNLALVEYTFGAVQMVYQNCFNYLGSAFVDYVHCLVEFSMNPFLAEDTVLGAVRLLATCGQRMMVDSGLKESEFKDTEVENKDETTSSSIAVNIVPSTPTSTSWRMSQSLEEEQFFFRWFPVVSALSRIVIESESPRVRSHALDTLFDILRSTGGIFETAHWRKLYRSVLAPLFEDLRSPESRRKHDMIGIWVQTLRQMIVLYDMFYEAFASNPEFLDQIMDLIGLMTESKALPTPASGSTTTEPSLGQMSVGCLYQLVSQCSTRFDEAAWEAVTRGIEKLFTGTTPIELLEVGEYERRESWKRPLEEDDSPRSDDLGGLHEAKTSMPINGWPRSRPTSMSTPEQSGQRSPRQSSPPALNGKNSNGFYLDFAAAVVKCGIHLAAIQCVRDLTIEDTSYLPMPTIRQSSSTNDRPLSPLPPAYSLARLPAHLRERWTCCLYNSYIFARQFNGNYPLRAYLFRSGYVQQMPNLIKQETLALTVYIAMLFDVYRAIGDGGDPESPAADVVSEAKQMITRFTDLIDAEPAKNQRDVTKNLRDMANWACLPVVVYREISKTPWWQETIGWRKEQQEEEKGESVRYITLKQEMMWFFKTAVKMVGVSNVEVRRSVQDFLEGMSEYLEIV